MGAGPGGCSVAYYLAKDSDLEVTLIERLQADRYERYHRMCGEALSSRTFSELPTIRPWGALHEIRRAHEVWPGGTEVDYRVKGYVMDRTTFLRRLIRDFKERGGELLSASVSQVRREDDDFSLLFTNGERANAQFLVGADGAHSTVRRQLFGEEPRVMIPVKQYVVDRPMDDHTIRFYYDEKYQGGYRWEFPSGSGTKIGFPMGTDEPPAGPLEEHSRHIPFGVDEVCHKGVCLVGDAAGQVNPLTFGGIRTAMVAGRNVALAIRAGDTTKYEAWWKNSPFSSPIFERVFLRLKGMSNQEMQRSMRPFATGCYPLSYIWAWLVNKEYRELYRAYRLTSKYGW